ncbi:MAG: vanadium-dependent haloperoxidase [Alphaproteobacteria bacterium]|nr:vanadium-dependent haloperoxidase [Alphaproteobacteria bacterium]
MKRVFALALLLPMLFVAPASASSLAQEQVLSSWYHLILRLVRHTATYSPPLASRNFAYLGVTSYEAVASGDDHLQSLAGQLHGLKPLPPRQAGKAYDESVVLNAAMAAAMVDFFGNTGPSGQNALRAETAKMSHDVAQGLAPDVVGRSEAYGKALAAQIFTWSKSDGGATIVNMGFPLKYKLTPGPAHWVPTNQQGIQQVPLLPEWQKNRTFALPAAATCDLPPPPEYSEDKSSEFYKQALEVHDVKNSATPEQKAIARFWSDDPMLSPTPPGHWVSIVMQIAEHDHLPAAKTADALARVGVAVADAFIGCWQTKFEYDLVRPVTYIKRVIDPKWETLLITPPFPEYASGHSVQSAAAAAVLSTLLGDHYAFDDATHVQDGIPARHFESFEAAAAEAGISRMYGGIHYRAAIERGLQQGRCIGAYAAALKTVK